MKEYLNTNEAAEFLGYAASSLRQWRCTKKHNIPYSKIGRDVRYKREDLIKFMEERKKTEFTV